MVALLGLILAYCAVGYALFALCFLPQRMSQDDLAWAGIVTAYCSLGVIPAYLGYRLNKWDLCIGCVLNAWMWPLVAIGLLACPADETIAYRRAVGEDSAPFAVLVMPATVGAAILAVHLWMHLEEPLRSVAPLAALIGPPALLLHLADRIGAPRHACGRDGR